mmetsp:Transcript_39816/g.102565  ORF Transcript_39816/g.102565 Transcript_39816/m.102565 type:complete len:159 (-) Transcript_39816:1851-2327(-)
MDNPAIYDILEKKPSTYVVTADDMKKHYIKTTGITSRMVGLNEDFSLRLYDTGGQRVERKKWHRVLVSSVAMVFVLNAAEYTGPLYEDGTTNCSHEAFECLKMVVSQDMMRSRLCPFHVCITQIDLLEMKLKYVPFNSVHLDYDGVCLCSFYVLSKSA